MNFRVYILLLFLFALPALQAAELPGIPQFIDGMVTKHAFKRDELERVFSHSVRRQSIIDAISAPATLKPWQEYRATFVNEQRINSGLQFWELHADALLRAERQFAVPQEIIVALIGVETAYGRNPGKYYTLDALTTLAFDYPRRADFFRGELEQYLLLAREQELDLFKVQGSYAGALGIPQFMPSSYRKYAVDFSGNGKIDLLHDTVDAIGSVANYLKQYGWVYGMPVAVQVTVGAEVLKGKYTKVHTLSEWAASGVKPNKEIAPYVKVRLMDYTVAEGKEYWLAFGNFEVITRYNNSDFYAMSVFQLAEALHSARQ
jgi:membrane-bound lytic murein transglycosylase B